MDTEYVIVTAVDGMITNVYGPYTDKSLATCAMDRQAKTMKEKLAFARKDNWFSIRGFRDSRSIRVEVDGAKKEIVKLQIRKLEYPKEEA